MVEFSENKLILSNDVPGKSQLVRGRREAPMSTAGSLLALTTEWEGFV